MKVVQEIKFELIEASKNEYKEQCPHLSNFESIHVILILYPSSI